MGWARNTPLHVWGSSGYTPELGITALAQHVMGAAEWHIQNKQSILPRGGMTIVPHEIDISKFSPETPRQLAYDERGVKIYAFPVIHALAGIYGFPAGMERTYVCLHRRQSAEHSFEAEQGAKGARVYWRFMRFSHLQKNSPTITICRFNQPPRGVMEEHTTPAELGQVYTIAKPWYRACVVILPQDENPLSLRRRSSRHTRARKTGTNAGSSNAVLLLPVVL